MDLADELGQSNSLSRYCYTQNYVIIITIATAVDVYACSCVPWSCDVLQLVEHFINQNNSIDVYQPYFTDPSCQTMQTLAPSFKTVAVMSDPCGPTRPVQHISWSPDRGTLVAVSYADMRFQMADPECSPDSFVFDMGKRLKHRDTMVMPEVRITYSAEFYTSRSNFTVPPPRFFKLKPLVPNT